MRTAVIGATVIALAALAGVHEAAAQGLDILVTNDDGYRAPGITTLRSALVAAGHRVTIVAPLDNRSGSGMTGAGSGTIDYYEQSDGVWAVDGTPADAVSIGLVHILRDNPPDLVVSGSNFGHNAGANVMLSGTVGAALTASRSGVPAIAVSVAVDLDEGPPFRSTGDAFQPAAELVVELVRQLRETDAQGLLPPRTILNVNYPAVGSGEVAGIRFATLASVRPFRRVYAVAGESGPARVETTATDPASAEPGSDYALLSEGYVTISVLDGDIDAGRESWESLLERLIIER